MEGWGMAVKCIKRSTSEELHAKMESLDWILSRDDEFRYMLLDRMRQDCEYFLGFGGRSARVLWAGDVDMQIEYMRAIWNSFKVKPEWLSMEQIEDFKRRMK